MTFDDRFGLLADAERVQRENRLVGRLLKGAKLKAPSACGEDIDFATHRGLDKRQVLDLLTCQWIERYQHLLVTGSTGVGKTWLACALRKEAVRKGFPVTYKRLARLLEELELRTPTAACRSFAVRLRARSC